MVSLGDRQMTEFQKQIELTDLGPIASLTIPIPAEGGCVVLTGRNGSGKSTALEAIRAAVGGKTRLSARDGSAKGRIEAFGATVTVAASQRRKGEAEVVSLEGRGDVAALVDPGIASPEAADAARVRAIVALSGREVTEAAFHGLLAGAEEWAEIVGAVKPGDPLEMAGTIKRAIEAAARKAEKQAEDASALASSLLGQNEGLDLSTPCDAGQLAETYTFAREALAEARATVEPRRAKYAAILDAARRASALMPPTVDLDAEEGRLTAALTASRGALQVVDDQRMDTEVLLAELDTKKRELETRLAHAKERAAIIASDIRAEVAELDAIAVKKTERDRLLALAAEPLPDDPSTDGTLEVLAVNVADAKRAMEAGGAVREALGRQRKAEDLVAKRNTIAKRAERLRDAAAGVDKVLTSLVADLCREIRIEGGRLVTDTRRGRTLFADLSHGERWRLALEFAIGAVGRGGVLVCPQEAWEGLDPRNRAAVAEQLRGTGVVMFTAACSSGAGIEAEVVA